MSLTLLLFILAGEPLTYAAGYIPNVQFAPFYVANTRGYYKEEGIDLKMDYTMGPDVFKLAALGKVQIASADPDAFLHAAARGMPLVHVATLYQNYPIALISKTDVFTKEALAGKRIGISGTYGSSYLGLKAMLTELDLNLKEVQVSSIGYTQVTSLQQNRVDVVVGYINNEPVRLKAQGIQTKTHTLSQSASFPGVGLMVSKKFMSQHPERVKAFLRATFKGMHDVLEDPEGCYKLIVENYLPELKAKDRYDNEYKILLATLPFWASSDTRKNGYGQCDPALWKQLAEAMQKDQNSSAYGDWSRHVNRDFRLKLTSSKKN